MKTLFIYTSTVLSILFISFCPMLTAYAQETGGTTTTTSSKTTTTTRHEAIDTSWLADNWIWLAAGIIVLIVLIAVISSGKKTTTTIERTTVIRDNGPTV